MAYCKYCGAEVNGGKFCSNCGAQIEEEIFVRQIEVPVPVQKPMNVLGLLGMIFGISACVLIWVPILDLCLAITAVILSGIGMAKSNQYRLNGFAIAGLACGIVAVIFSLIILVEVFVVAAQNYPYYGNMY